MSVPTAFEGEVRLRRWSESSTQGVQVTFALAESTELDRFKGLEGKRFMAVLVQIGDDERPVEPEKRIDHSWYRQASIWCQDKEFQGWIAHRLNCQPDAINESDARAYVLAKCEIDSRKELDSSEEARGHWLARIAGPYRKHLIARGLE